MRALVATARKKNDESGRCRRDEGQGTGSDEATAANPVSTPLPAREQLGTAVGLIVLGFLVIGHPEKRSW